MDQLSIREILDSIYRGQIRIPAFQRGFVWEPERVAFLIDSIYKGYPFGSLLFWRTNEQLQSERELGTFKLPDPEADFPIDYVLDGQQRITSIFGVFQTELKSEGPSDWKDIYFDYSSTDDVQEAQFFALSEDEYDSSKHFPLKALFNTTEYRKLTRNFDDELATRIDAMQAIFKEAKIPVESFRTEQKEKVAIIFERINRQGVPLDTLQLLSAWTWSEEFQLQSQFEELIDELTSYGFSELTEDINLLLRCTTAILAHTANVEDLVQINGSDIRRSFDSVHNGIKGSLDFLKSELKVESIKNLPYQQMLIPLSAFFAVPGSIGTESRYTDAQRKAIVQWFWKTSFSKRYSAGTMKKLNEDISEMIKLQSGQSSRLTDINLNLDSTFFTSNKFQMNTVHTNTFILMLAQNSPRSFITGSLISLSDTLRICNRKEFHHLMPKDFLRSSQQTLIYDENCLANFCFLSRQDNRQLGGQPPSQYRSLIAVDDINSLLESHLCSSNLFDDNYADFIASRASKLCAYANNLIST